MVPDRLVPTQEERYLEKVRNVAQFKLSSLLELGFKVHTRGGTLAGSH